MRRSLRAWLYAGLLVGFASGACAPVRPALSPGPDTGWRRVTSEHFVVEGPGEDVEALREMASELELLFDALKEVPVLGGRAPKARTLVVVFDSARSFRAVGGKSGAVYFARSALGSLLVIPPHQRVWRSETLRHEITHVLLEAHITRAPRWLHEGLASLMQTARYVEAERKVRFGEPSRHLLSLTPRAHDIRAEALLTGDLTDRAAFYGAAWLLAHYLVDHHLEELAEYLRLLSKGMEEAQAWRIALPLPRDRIDEALNRYSLSARLGVWSVDARPPAPGALTPSTPSRADTIALRAGLLVHSSELEPSTRARLEIAEAEVDEALALEPGNPRARAVKAFIDKARAERPRLEPKAPAP